MGILNVTPDSFYSKSRVTPDDITAKAGKMIEEGATILDIGAQSTRPGSKQCGATEEADRLLPSVAAIRKTFPGIFISADTYHASVATQAVAAGADIINDVSGGNIDPAMISAVAALKVPFICMHMKGTPETMQQLAQYNDVTREVLDYFIAKTNECKNAGITDVIIDPGFGFAKSISHNLQLLRKLHTLKILERPLLAGLSRKSTVYKTLHITADEALNGTTVLHTIALMNGASILRVHDVKEAIEAITLTQACMNA